MKRIIAAVLLVAFAQLTGCGAAQSAPAAPAASASAAAEVASGNAEEASGNAMETSGGAAEETSGGLTAEQLIGVWRQENHEELTDNMDLAFELCFTDEGMMYITQYVLALDAGYIPNTLECDYSVENGVIIINKISEHSWIEEWISDVSFADGSIVFTTLVYDENGRERIEVFKTSDEVPDKFTTQGRELIADTKNSMRERARADIIAYSEELSERTGLSLEVIEDTSFNSMIIQSVHFTSGDDNFYIVQRAWANVEYYDPLGYYELIQKEGAWVQTRPCYIVDKYVIVFEGWEPEPPEAWREFLDENALGAPSESD